MFQRKTQVRTGLFLEELPGHPVIAIGHSVEYDPTRKLWFCDIDLDEQAVDTYYPFIRLAIARFQPKSIDGAHLSRVMLTDFIQLAPSRVAELAFPNPQVLSITVSGVPGVNSITYKDLNKSKPGVALTDNLDASRVMQVNIQRPVDPARLDDELGWETVGPDSLLKATLAKGHQVDWTGTVTLPAVPKRMGGQQDSRVLIREFERLQTDPDVRELTFTRGSVKDLPMCSRLVYADALVI